jgi:integral membrane protein
MTALHQFRIAALLEGWSYLVLLFIAMPLKYAAGMPLAVRIVGSVHGFLFITFIIALYRVVVVRNWPLRRAIRGFLYSLTPFGAFVFDRSLVRELARAEGDSSLRSR